MTETGASHNDLQSYLAAWTKMMITIWQEKIIMLGAVDTWELYHSFTSNIAINAGGDGARIDFAFRKYGFYVNAGIGGEMRKGNAGDVSTSRASKPWFDKGWYKSIYALRRDVATIYGEMAAKNIVFYLNNTIV
jgi:hypothetical protein